MRDKSVPAVTLAFMALNTARYAYDVPGYMEAVKLFHDLAAALVVMPWAEQMEVADYVSPYGERTPTLKDVAEMLVKAGARVNLNHLSVPAVAGPKEVGA